MYVIKRFDVDGRQDDTVTWHCKTFTEVRKALGGLPISQLDEYGCHWCFDGKYYYSISKE